jgi:hypothetical protein
MECKSTMYKEVYMNYYLVYVTVIFLGFSVVACCVWFSVRRNSWLDHNVVFNPKKSGGIDLNIELLRVALNSDILLVEYHTILHSWGEYFIRDMILDMANSITEKKINNRHSDNYKKLLKKNIDKVMNNSVEELLKYCIICTTEADRIDKMVKTHL